MPNRIIKESICTSPNVDQLSRDAEVFFYRLLVQCDDFGRMDARQAILRARCYPLQIGRVSETDIGQWLAELETAGLVRLYTVDAGEYLHVQTWEKHQQVRAKRSKYPQPPSDDNTRNHLIADDSKCPRNPIQSNPNPIVIAEPIDEDERSQAIQALQEFGLFNGPMLMQFNDMWPELTGRRDWIGKAITVARDKGASSPAYAIKVLANSLHTGKEPGYTPSKTSYDPDSSRRGVPAPPKEEQDAADARQAAYERQIAAELARAGRLP